MKESHSAIVLWPRNFLTVLDCNDLNVFTAGTTILDAVKAAVGSETEVTYEQHPSPATLDSQAFSYAIVAVGEEAYAESLGDNKDLTIPFNGNDVIRSVAEKIPTLMILVSGRPLVIEPEILSKVDAFVAAWLPGSEGNGITDVIFGDYNFVGKLPVSWFRSVDQLPLNAAEANSYDPLFPLGSGFTYGEIPVKSK